MPVKYLKESPSQTAGPYVHIGLMPAVAGLNIRTQEKPNILASGAVKGERIRIEGVVIDGTGHPVPEAVIEIWQANADGVHDDPNFSGFGRAQCDLEKRTGEWWFETVKPGPVTTRSGVLQAPHVTLLVLARGINIHLHTRMYFGDEDAANKKDPVLNSVDMVQRRATLIAPRMMKGSMPVYRFEIRLQGEGETVFFDC